MITLVFFFLISYTFIEQNYDIVDNTLYVKIYSKGDYSLILEKRDYILNENCNVERGKWMAINERKTDWGLS